jgi:hypothetical protein
MPAPVLLPFEIANDIVGTVDLTLGGAAAVVSMWLAFARRTRRLPLRGDKDAKTAAAPGTRKRSVVS